MVASARGMSTRAAQAERTRQQILQTAQRLFAEVGYDATSLQMIADELGLTKAAVYYYFHTKRDILDEAMRPGFERLMTLHDEAAMMRGRRARVEHLVSGYVDFLVKTRHYFGVMAYSEPHTPGSDQDDKSTKLRQRAMSLIFGDHPTAAERVAFDVAFFLPKSLPNLVDVPDEELREALKATILRIFRVPSRPERCFAPWQKCRLGPV
jgi:AcrR family transcriptional regulator